MLQERCSGETYLHVYNGYDALGFVKVPGDPVYSLRDKVQHQVEVNLIFLWEQPEINDTLMKTSASPKTVTANSSLTHNYIPELVIKEREFSFIIVLQRENSIKILWK